MVGDQAGCNSADARGIGDVELDRDHAGIGDDNFVERRAPAAGNDHLVAARVERLGEPPGRCPSRRR